LAVAFFEPHSLIESTERGIWVTRFNYVNGLLEPKTALMTGLTRDGTFLIRDGKVAARLPNLRFRPKHAPGTPKLPAEESIEVVEGATPAPDPAPELQPQQSQRAGRQSTQ